MSEPKVQREEVIRTERVESAKDTKAELIDAAKSAFAGLIPAEKGWMAAWVVSLALLVITDHLASQYRSKQMITFVSTIESNRADENRRLHGANDECQKTLARIAEREQRQFQQREVMTTTLGTILDSIQPEELTDNEEDVSDHLQAD